MYAKQKLRIARQYQGTQCGGALQKTTRRRTGETTLETEKRHGDTETYKALPRKDIFRTFSVVRRNTTKSNLEELSPTTYTTHSHFQRKRISKHSLRYPTLNDPCGPERGPGPGLSPGATVPARCPLPRGPRRAAAVDAAPTPADPGRGCSRSPRTVHPWPRCSTTGGCTPARPTGEGAGARVPP